jgi:hypothetical protein
MQWVIQAQWRSRLSSLGGGNDAHFSADLRRNPPCGTGQGSHLHSVSRAVAWCMHFHFGVLGSLLTVLDSRRCPLLATCHPRVDASKYLPWPCQVSIRVYIEMLSLLVWRDGHLCVTPASFACTCSQIVCRATSSAAPLQAQPLLAASCLQLTPAARCAAQAQPTAAPAGRGRTSRSAAPQALRSAQRNCHCLHCKCKQHVVVRSCKGNCSLVTSA